MQLASCGRRLGSIARWSIAIAGGQKNERAAGDQEKGYLEEGHDLLGRTRRIIGRHGAAHGTIFPQLNDLRYSGRNLTSGQPSLPRSLHEIERRAISIVGRGPREPWRSFQGELKNACHDANSTGTMIDAKFGSIP